MQILKEGLDKFIKFYDHTSLTKEDVDKEYLQFLKNRTYPTKDNWIYSLPEFKDTMEASLHALNEADKRVKSNQLAYAATGGPLNYIWSTGGKWLQIQGIEVLQIANCETTSEIDVWAGVFNAYIDANEFLISLKNPRDDNKYLSQLIRQSREIEETIKD